MKSCGSDRSDWTKLGLVRDYEVPADKITVIPPGVNVQEWRRPTPRVPHTDPVKILFVGGDLERKGGLVLLEAFRALRHLGLELHLVTKDRLPAFSCRLPDCIHSTVSEVEPIIAELCACTGARLRAGA